MEPEQASEVAGIHASVLTDSVYTWIGRPFLEYYYRNLPENRDFSCHVHTFNGRVTGFLASTSAARHVFLRQIFRDAFHVSAVALGAIAREPQKLGIVLSAIRFLFMQHPKMLPHVNGEVLSFAVLPEYRTAEVGSDGTIRPTEFYAKWKVPVATELFFGAMQNLATRGAREVKIMTPADNPASNRFYAKMGCRLAAAGLIIFGHPTNLYCGRVDEVLSRERTTTITSLN